MAYGLTGVRGVHLARYERGNRSLVLVGQRGRCLAPRLLKPISFFPSVQLCRSSFYLVSVILRSAYFVLPFHVLRSSLRFG